jgi:hypothetical protein
VFRYLLPAKPRPIYSKFGCKNTNIAVQFAKVTKNNSKLPVNPAEKSQDGYFLTVGRGC